MVDSYAEGEEGVLSVNGGTLVGLKGPKRLAITSTIRYLVVRTADAQRGPFKVTTRGWMHTIYEDGREVFAYHWHPLSDSHVTVPHLHAHWAPDRLHVPTGRVLLEDLLRVAEDLGAEPDDKDKWNAVDQENRESFARGATWGVTPV